MQFLVDRGTVGSALELILMVSLKAMITHVSVIASLLRDVQTLQSGVFSQRALRLTIAKIESRCSREGESFFTKSLPRLGKALDRALTGECILDTTGWRKLPNSQLPRFLGELFQRVFAHDGRVLQSPCIFSIRHLRQILYLYYKYKLPYTTKQEDEVIQAFKKAEEDIVPFDNMFHEIADSIDRACSIAGDPFRGQVCSPTLVSGLNIVRSTYWRSVIRKARKLLNRVFQSFDPTDISPRHGPGAVSTKEKLWEKYRFTSYPPRVAAAYPADAYLYASPSHVCDRLNLLMGLDDREHPAQVILVQKDSRGPRLISCEPLYLQWLQQGLGRAIVELVERHPLTRDNVRFTDQEPNRNAALLGSRDGRYATLDLKEASDRVSLGLIRALFPSKVLPYLLATRSLSTRLPDGSTLPLRKFAPMGSCLCFPIMALTIWAVLTAATEDTDARKSIYVYGDDVIVKKAYALHAIEHLEAVGLKINLAKSCISGFFRESCGMDAYKGSDVTPLRIRSVWSSSPSPESYASWIAYANSMYDRSYYHAYWTIVDGLKSVYGCVPSEELVSRRVPSLREVPQDWKQPRRRLNVSLQRVEHRVLVLVARPIRRYIDGWEMLLRYFAESSPSPLTNPSAVTSHWSDDLRDNRDWFPKPALSVSQYTKRHDVKMSWRWR